MACYYPGCSEPETTTEHLPPKSFFPKDQRNQLLTVPSCKLHNNAKSLDDTYVLAHICMNASPSSRSREIFMKTIAPQLGYNRGALRKTLAEGSVPLASGGVAYPVNVDRFDRFFDALSYGIVFKACGESLPGDYSTGHVYHNFEERSPMSEAVSIEKMIRSFYSGEPMAFLTFGKVRSLNTTVYSVKLFGVPGFLSSITIVHEFFGVFRVTSMLSKKYQFAKE